MSGRENNDSSGNLAAGEPPTVPDFTVDPSSPGSPDPNDTQQDPQAARRSSQDLNVTNDPNSALRGIVNSQGMADGDTMEDPLAVRKKEWPDPLAPDDTMEDPQAAGKQVWTDPLAPGETVKEGHGQGRKLYPDPLAPDATQPSVSSHATSRDAKSGASAGSSNTNWDPIGGTPPASSNSSQARPAKKKPGQAFSEGDLFARKYEIKGHIGQGGMGVVYKALDLVLGRTVAIKFLKGKSGISQLEMSRFQQEAKAIASLNHTNIIRVHDMSVTDDGDPFFVLEYLEGHALSSEIRGKKQLSLDRVFSIISQVCDALQHAHEHGVIHRDIKPSNLMIVPQKDGTDQVKLLDFGIAKLNPVDEQTLLKLTKTGELFGSPHYMSPEQCTGKTIAEQSDIYSLGCVLYELICGAPPFSGQSALDTLDKHKNASLPSVANTRNDLSESKLIDDLLDKMMAKEPSERYQTPAEVKAAIQEISKKLEGSSFQQFKKKLFPSGLSDAKGKKSLAVLVAALASLAGSVYLVSQIPSFVKTKAPDSVPSLPKSWTWYDTKGQQLFDMGSYKLAEKELLHAYEKAKTDQSEKRKLRLFTSLQELRMLYTVLKNSEKIDWAKSELIDLNAEQFLDPTPSKYSWEDISKRLSQANSPEKLNRVVEMSRDLAITGNSVSRKQSTSKMLSSLRKKVELIPNSELIRDQFVLLEGFHGMGEGRAMSPDLKAVILKLTVQPAEQLGPAMANVLVAVGIGQSDIDQQSLEKFSEYAAQEGTPFERLIALEDLSSLYFESERKAAAKETIEKCITEAEKVVPRHYFVLVNALLKRAVFYESDRDFLAAIALYRRALSISECVPSIASFGLRPNTLRSYLARAYVGAGNDEEAESTLVSVIENQDVSTDLLRANSYRQLGSLYLRQKKLDKAQESLEKSVAIYRSQKLSVRFHIDRFNDALSELARVRIMRKADGASGQNNASPISD